MSDITHKIDFQPVAPSLGGGTGEALDISIIIPVYNVEQYLRKCLDSILRQGLHDGEYEVILVSDGSKDGSVAICEEYCRQYPHFRLIKQENQGVSAARNNGMEHARGKYIVFADADDYLLDNGLNLAYEHFRGRDDIDVIHYYSSYDNWEKNEIDNTIDFDGTGHELIMQGGLPSFCWLCFYSKAFLDRHHLRFKPYIVGEDQLFSSAVYIANPRIVSTRARFYRYVIHEGSATTRRSVEHTRRCVDDYLDSYRDIMACMEQYGIRQGTPLYDACIRSVNSKKMFGFSRILSAEYTRKQYKEVMEKCRNIGFYPVQRTAAGMKHKLTVALMNSVMRHRWLYRPASFAFNRIVVPYVPPRIRKTL